MNDSATSTIQTFSLTLPVAETKIPDTLNPDELESLIQKKLSDCIQLLRWAIVRCDMLESSQEGLRQLVCEGAYLRKSGSSAPLNH